MDKNDWKTVIEEACKAAGTFQPFFASVIDTLAGIMEMRDDAEAKFRASGGNTVVTYTNRGGEKNYVKNPMMVAMLDCNAQALTYWKELGLTGKAYKEIFGAKPGNQNTTVEDVLARIGL